MYTNLEVDAKSSVDDVCAFLAGNKSSAGLSSILYIIKRIENKIFE